MSRVLLAIAVLGCAQTHSAVTSQHPRVLQALGDATKALQAAQQSLEVALRQPALTSVSVVQDWSLVCKELCGAGLGVAPCAEHCAASGARAATAILSKDFVFAKTEQRQGSSAGSGHNISDESVRSLGRRLCRSFCQQRQRSLNGCSPCQLQDAADGANGLDVSDRASGEQRVTSHGPGAVGAGRAMATDTATTEMEVSDRQADDGTPDWDEMCKALCKTGDGGSLCNCDLSPFLI